MFSKSIDICQVSKYAELKCFVDITWICPVFQETYKDLPMIDSTMYSLDSNTV